MHVPYARNIRDAAKVVTKALPAANANHNTDAIDLEQTQGGLIENMEFEIEIPALPSLVDEKVVTITALDSEDNNTFAPIDPLIRTTVTGVSTNGSAAKDVRFRLPSTARRYIALNIAVENGGGNNTAQSITLHALF